MIGGTTGGGRIGIGMGRGGGTGTGMGIGIGNSGTGGVGVGMFLKKQCSGIFCGYQYGGLHGSSGVFVSFGLRFDKDPSIVHVIPFNDKTMIINFIFKIVVT